MNWRPSGRKKAILRTLMLCLSGFAECSGISVNKRSLVLGAPFCGIIEPSSKQLSSNVR